MTLLWAPKSPTEVVYRNITWIGPLAGADIVTSTVVLTPETASIILTDVSTTTDEVRATISGGLSGELAILTNTVTTSDGRTLVQSIVMAVLDSLQTLVPTGPSTSTKRQLVEMAFEECGLDPYEFNPTPQEYATALRRLDALMLVFEGPGNNLPMGYNAPVVFGQSDLSDVSGIPDIAIDAVSQQLALRIAPNLGKTLSAETKAAYSQNLAAMRTAFSVIPERALQPGTPRGAGNKPQSVWAPFGFQGGN